MNTRAFAYAALILAASSISIGLAAAPDPLARGMVYFTGKAVGASEMQFYRGDMATGQAFAAFSAEHAGDVKAMTLGTDGNLYAALSYSTSASDWVDSGILDSDGNPVYEWQTITTHHNKLNVYNPSAAGNALVYSLRIDNVPAGDAVVRALAFDGSGQLHLQYGLPMPRGQGMLYTGTIDIDNNSLFLNPLNAPDIRGGAMIQGHDGKLYQPGSGSDSNLSQYYDCVRAYDPATPGVTSQYTFSYTGSVQGMAFSPRGNLFMMTGDESGTGALVRNAGGTQATLALNSELVQSAGLAMDAQRNLVYAVRDAGDGSMHLRSSTPKGVLAADMDQRFESVSNLTAAALPVVAPDVAPARALVPLATELPGVAGVTISGISAPAVSGPTGSGPVVFGFGSGLDGICRVGRDGSSLETLAYKGQLVPGTTATYTFMSRPSANSAGSATFQAYTSTAERIMRVPQSGPAEVVLANLAAITSADVPGAVGTWRIGSMGNPMINDAGQVSVPVRFERNVGGAFPWTTSGTGIYRINANNTKTLMAYNRWQRAGSQVQVPGGTAIHGGSAGDYVSGITSVTMPMKINSAGKIAFGGWANISGVSYTAAMLADGGGTARVLICTGGAFNSFKQLTGGMVQLAFNDLDQVALPATLADGGSGIYRASPAGVTEIVRDGVPAPDYHSPTGYNGVFANGFDGTYSMPVSLSEAGHVMFAGEALTGTTGGSSDNRGLFIGNGSQIAPVIREGQALGGGEIFHFGSLRPFGSINSLGHAAFTGQIEDDEGGLRNALFISSGRFVKPLVVQGQTINGAEVTGISLSRFPDLTTSTTGISISDDDRVTFMAGGRICITDLSAAAGISESNPILPTSVTGTGLGTIWRMVDAQSGAWIDPPTADHFTYTMTGTSLFTEILNFPTGYAGLEVWTGGTLLGTYSSGDSVVFPGGVSSFSIRGITPGIDVADGHAFPLQLAFDTPTADFTMQVPEPMIAGFTLLGSMLVLRRYGHSQPGPCKRSPARLRVRRRRSGGATTRMN